MKVKPGLPVAASAAFVLIAVSVLLAATYTRPPVAPCPAVEGVSPSPSPGVCRGVTVTTAPRPVIVVTVPPGSPQAPVVVREPGETRTVVSVSPSPVPPPRPPPSRSSSPTATPAPSPTCVLPLLPPGCLGRGHTRRRR